MTPGVESKDGLFLALPLVPPRFILFFFPAIFFSLGVFSLKPGVGFVERALLGELPPEIPLERPSRRGFAVPFELFFYILSQNSLSLSLLPAGEPPTSKGWGTKGDFLFDVAQLKTLFLSGPFFLISFNSSFPPF